jgi:hypothetical protein
MHRCSISNSTINTKKPQASLRPQKATATGMFPQPFKSDGHGADAPMAVQKAAATGLAHPWPLRLSMNVAGQTPTDRTEHHTDRRDGRAADHIDRESIQPATKGGLSAFVAATDLVIGHQAHLQQALTRDSEKPKIVSW